MKTSGEIHKFSYFFRRSRVDLCKFMGFSKFMGLWGILYYPETPKTVALDTPAEIKYTRQTPKTIALDTPAETNYT